MIIILNVVNYGRQRQWLKMVVEDSRRKRLSKTVVENGPGKYHGKCCGKGSWKTIVNTCQILILKRVLHTCYILLPPYFIPFCD